MGGAPDFSGHSPKFLQVDNDEDNQDTLEDKEDEEGELREQSQAAVPVLACGDDLIFGQVGNDAALQVLWGAAPHIPVQIPVLLPLEPGAQVEDVTGAFPRVALQVDYLEAPQVVKEPIGNRGEPVGTEVDDFSRGTEGSGQVFYSQVFQ